MLWSCSSGAGVVSYIICMLDVLCKIIIIIKINKFNHFSYIDIIISVYGIMYYVMVLLLGRRRPLARVRGGVRGGGHLRMVFFFFVIVVFA